MTYPENGKPLWTESRVDTLLEEFFRNEMPPALRSPRPARSSRDRIPTAPLSITPQIQSAKTRANSVAGFLMVGFSSLLILMVAVLTWNGSPIDPKSPVHSTSDGSSSEETPAESGSESWEGWKDDGPVEMRSRTRPVGTEESTGEKSPFPELDIEVYPLDRDRSVDEEPKESELPESRSRKTNRAPLPEESRRLPENSPPDSADPDEAHLHPMLPELRGLFGYSSEV